MKYFILSIVLSVFVVAAGLLALTFHVANVVGSDLMAMALEAENELA